MYAYVLQLPEVGVLDAFHFQVCTNVYSWHKSSNNPQPPHLRVGAVMGWFY